MEENLQQDTGNNHSDNALTMDERAYASLAHFLQIGTWWIGPLIVYLMHRKSRFVSFHALQAILFQGLFTFLWILLIVVLIAGMILSMPIQNKDKDDDSPPEFPWIIIFFPFIWLLGMGGWVLTLVLAIVFGIKAIHGKWDGYPLLGRLAKKITGD